MHVTANLGAQTTRVFEMFRQRLCRVSHKYRPVFFPAARPYMLGNRFLNYLNCNVSTNDWELSIAYDEVFTDHLSCQKPILVIR